MFQVSTAILFMTSFTLCSRCFVDGLPGGSPESYGSYEELFTPEIFDKMINTVPGELCRAQLKQYQVHAGNFTLWAMEMLDASAKFPSGILGGSIYHLGHFDECLAVDNGQSGEDRITGKYCIATIEITPRGQAKTKRDEGDPAMCSAWDKLEVSNNRMKIRRNRLQAAICVPSACSSQDLQMGLQFLKAKFKSVSFDVTVDEKMCQTGNQETGPWLSIFWWAVLFYASFLFVFNQFYISNKTDNAAPSVFHRVFDLGSHWQWLSSTEAHEGSLDSIDCIHGGRVFFMLLIMIGHRGEEIGGGPVINGDSIEAMSEDTLSTLVLSGHIIVDVFFTISGYLVAWNLLRNLDRGVKINVPFLYFLRFLRLTPTMMLVIGFEALVLADLSTGPLWKFKVGREVENCQKYWWTNLFYVNNYVHPENPCVGPSWYLACDMQMFLVATLIVVGLHNRSKQHVFLGLSAAIAASIVVPFVITYIGDLDPTFIPDPSSLGHSAVDATYVSVYVTAYCRAGPYLVGMAFAYWLNNMMSRKAKMPKSIMWLGWTLCPVIQVTLVASASTFYQPDHQVGRMTTALFAALHRPVIAVGIAFYITCGANGQGGFLNRWFSWSALRPLSRLTYALFLIHSVVQMYHIATLRTQLQMSTTDIIWLAMGDVLISVIFATLLYLTVERPVMILATAIFEMSGGAAQVRDILKKEQIRQEENGQASSFSVSLNRPSAIELTPQQAKKIECNKKKQG